MWMLIHGFTGSPRSWDEVITLADFDQEPLLPTLTGHGPDWRGAKIGTFEDEVARMASMALAFARPRLVCGYSMGARVALGMLIDHADLWDAALLIGVHPGLRDQAERNERRRVDSARARRLRTQGLAAFVDDWEELPLFHTQRELSTEASAAQREVRLSHDAEGLAHALELLGLAEMPDYGAGSSSIRAPVTLMAGAQDFRFSAMAHALAETNAQIDTTIVEGVGHNVVLEAPKSVAAALNRVERRVSR